MISGHNGSVLDQRGIKTIIKDGLDVNSSICAFGGCILGEANINTKSQDSQLDSIGWSLGAGEIGDVSVDLIQINDWFFYNKGENVQTQIPFFSFIEGFFVK